MNTSGVGAHAPSDGDRLLDRAAEGARLLTMRGLTMRVISIASNFLLLALVGPRGFGLLGVVRGIVGLIGFAAEFGVAGPLIRKTEHPSHAEYAALGGLQTIFVGVAVTTLVVATRATHLVDVVPPEWHWWLLACVAAVGLSPLGTGGRVRLERALNYRRIAFVDVSSVLLQNVGLLVFALIGHFALGVFVVQFALLVYINLLLFAWSPGPAPSFQPAGMRLLLRESATFSAAHVLSLFRENGLPLIIAHALGLPAAGIWSFATRMGQLLQGTLDGFRLAAIPAAGQLRNDPPRLRALATASLRNAIRIALPAAVLAVMGLPVLGRLLARWSGAVSITQWYITFLAISALATVALEPAGVAVRGPRVAFSVQAAGVAAGCAVLVVLQSLAGPPTLALLGPAMSIATTLALLGTTDRRVWPEWRDPARFALATVGVPAVAYATAMALNGGVFVAAALGGSMLAVVLTVWRTAERRATARLRGAPASTPAERAPMPVAVGAISAE